MTNCRDSISRRANRFLCAENFAQDRPGCPWIERTRAPMIAQELPRGEARTLREDRLHYIFVQERSFRVFSESQRSLTRDARRDNRSHTRNVCRLYQKWRGILKCDLPNVKLNVGQAEISAISTPESIPTDWKISREIFVRYFVCTARVKLDKDT